MKYVHIIFLVFIALNLNSQNTINIEKIFLFDTKVWNEVVNNIDSSNVKVVEVDSLDCQIIKNKLFNSKPKALPIYKPTVNDLYGIALISNEKIRIRIGRDVIFLATGNKRHYFIKDPKDREILSSLMLKYENILNENN